MCGIVRRAVRAGLGICCASQEKASLVDSLRLAERSGAVLHTLCALRE